jgi:hypothetical protein
MDCLHNHYYRYLGHRCEGFTVSDNHLFAARAAVPHTPSGAVVNRSISYSGAIGEM